MAAEGDGPYARHIAELASVLPDVRATTVLDGSDHGMRLIKSRLDDVAEAVDQAVGCGRPVSCAPGGEEIGLLTSHAPSVRLRSGRAAALLGLIAVLLPRPAARRCQGAA